MKIIIDVSVAKTRIPNDRMEKRLGGKQSVFKNHQQTLNELIGIIFCNVLNEFSRQSDPIAPAVNLNVPRQFPVSGAPHVRVALHKSLVQALFLYETLHFASVGFDKVSVAICAQEVGQTRDGFDGVVRLAEVEDKVEFPACEMEEFVECREKHLEKRGAAPDGRKAVAR